MNSAYTYVNYFDTKLTTKCLATSQSARVNKSYQRLFSYRLILAASEEKSALSTVNGWLEVVISCLARAFQAKQKGGDCWHRCARSNGTWHVRTNLANSSRHGLWPEHWHFIQNSIATRDRILYRMSVRGVRVTCSRFKPKLQLPSRSLKILGRNADVALSRSHTAILISNSGLWYECPLAVTKELLYIYRRAFSLNISGYISSVLNGPMLSENSQWGSNVMQKMLTLHGYRSNLTTLTIWLVNGKWKQICCPNSTSWSLVNC